MKLRYSGPVRLVREISYVKMAIVRMTGGI